MTIFELEQTEEGARFFSKVQKTATCWIWLAGKMDGYGWLRDKCTKKSIRAHKWLKTRIFGPVPEGKECCHTCNVRACVNPDHIYYGTRAENMRDIVKDKGHNWSRFPRKGIDHARSILTEAQELEIRRLHEEFKWGGVKISRFLGLNRHTVDNVLYRIRWTHLK